MQSRKITSPKKKGKKSIRKPQWPKDEWWDDNASFADLWKRQLLLDHIF